MAGTIYKPTTLLLRSKGIQARDAVDRVVEHGFLNMAGCLEREEQAVSSRFGHEIINRDAVGAGTSNYLFTSPPVTLTRLKSLTGATFRYAALADGSLWRRAGDIQGAYTRILAPGTLSGLPFTSLVTTMYESSQPYLLLCDGKQMLKDSGVGIPQQLGIFGPSMPVISAAYAPQFLIFSNFSNPSLFTGALGLTISTYNVFLNISGGYYGPQLGGDHYMYQWSTTLSPPAPSPIPDGSLLESAFFGDYGIKFNSDAYNQTFHFVSSTNVYEPVDNFHFDALTTNVTSSSAGTITYTFPANQDLSNYNPADLIVIVMRVLSPGNVSSVSINFDVNGSNYTSSYYTKTITPVSYQGFISNPLSTDAVTALTDAVLLQALTGSSTTTTPTTTTTTTTPTATGGLPGLIAGGYTGGVPLSTTPTTASTPSTVNSLASQIAQLTPPNLVSNGAWSTIYLQKGDFLPIGNANTPGLDWSVITGFQIAIVTNTDGGTEVDFNSLYIQGSPTTTGVGTNAGPSSYGGVGYDFRYIYYNANTGTPSNPSSQQLWAQTPLNPGEVSTLVVLRQAIDIAGQYSSDPQTTHVKLFARGGLYGDNWRYIDLIPNLPLSLPSETIAFISVNAIGYVTITTTAINAFGGFATITLNGLTAVPALNGQTVTVTAIPSPSQLQFYFPSLALLAVTAETGTITSPGFAGAGFFSYRYILPDTALQQGEILGLANDVPVTSSLQSPLNCNLLGPVVHLTSPNINYPQLENFAPFTLSGAGATFPFVPGQIVDIGNAANLEEVIVISSSGPGNFSAWMQFAHATGEPVQVFSSPAQPVPLSAIAYGTVWYAGDINNPHYLYYANKGYGGECVSPQNYIPCGTPSDPIVLVVNKRGTLFVSTLSTWYQIFPGNPPYAQSTGSKHGAVASFGWGDAEGEIWYEAADGIRTFKGSDGTYKSLPIEWLWRDNPLTPIPLIDTTQLPKVLAAYANNTATFIYIGQDGNRHRLIYDSLYQRWRNDNVPATAIYLEADTNTLVYSIPITVWEGPGWAIVYDSYSQDYDDGGWGMTGQLIETPIPITLQTPYLDVGAPNNQKQFNVMTIDANPNGQILTPTLLFDGNNGNVTPIIPNPPTFTGLVRDKFVFQIASGFGQQAYQISLQITGNVTAAPILYQAEMYAAVLADQRSSYDTYWVTLSNTNETKLVKQCFIDYTTIAGNTLLLQIFADGSLTPYFTIVLPENTSRSEVPMRVRFPAQILRLFRMIITSPAKFQLWSPVQLEHKLASSGKGYQRLDLGDVTP